MKTEITVLYNGKELKIPIEINDEQIHEIYKASNKTPELKSVKDKIKV